MWWLYLGSLFTAVFLGLMTDNSQWLSLLFRVMFCFRVTSVGSIRLSSSFIFIARFLSLLTVVGADFIASAFLKSKKNHMFYCKTLYPLFSCVCSLVYILTFIFVFIGFCCWCFLLLLFSLLWEVKHGTALPCDVLGKVVRGVHLQGFCGSGVLRKQSQHRWCSMPLHMAGSQPGELTVLLSSCLSSFSVLYVCQCPFLSVFLPVFCTCWPCLYWSATLSFSVSVCLHLCSFCMSSTVKA